MAYTGTGTEDNPYLVSTFGDFLTCIAIEGAYVKVIADIDASQEETYQSAYEGGFSIKANRIYADSLVEISNAIMQCTKLFELTTATGHDAEIENIYFKDIIYKCYTSDSYVFYSATYNFSFKSCAFVIYGEAGDKCSAIGQHFILNKCYLKCDYTNMSFPTSPTIDSIIESGLALITDSIIEIDGMTTGAGQVPQFFGTITYSTIKVDFLVNGFYSYQNTAMFGINSHDNILIANTHSWDGEAGHISFAVTGMTAIDSENSNCLFTGNTVHALTEEQIKSEEYLRSINFIP